MFCVLSLICNCLLIGLIFFVFKINQIKFKKKDILIVSIAIASLYVFYILSVVFRKFIYYWDYSCYYSISITSIQQYEQGFFSGIKHFLSSTWGGEYGNFLCYISQIIFGFTSKTPNAYLISCIILFIPYLVITFFGLLKTLKINTFLGFLIFSFFPVVHVQFLYGQPDIFGLVFIFLIISLCCVYDFKDKQYFRWALIIFSTLLLIITRRWYLYWIVSFYCCYIAYLVIKNIKNKQDLICIIKNGLFFSGCAMIVIGITMAPFFKNVLMSNNLSNYSQSYLVYGFWGELFAQVKRLGGVVSLSIICGMITSFFYPKYKLISILGIVHFFIIVFLFTRTQNMGLHHNLILVPVYMLFIYLFVDYIKNVKFQKIWLVLFICIYCINFIFCFYQNKKTWIFSNINLVIPKEKNYNQIGEIVSWMYCNLEDENIYLINHDIQHNPDKFRRYKMPDTFVGDRMSYGSTIYGTHQFPVELFTNKYIMVIIPFTPYGINEVYYNVFTQLQNDTFQMVKSFDLADNEKAFIYKRIKEVSLGEVYLYLDALQVQSQKFPHLYNDVIQQFITEKNLIKME